MSVFSNGGYVPEGMDFGEWLEFLDGMYDYEDYLDTQEELGEGEGFSEDLFLPELSDETIKSLKMLAAGSFEEIQRSFAGMDRDQAVEKLDELMDLNRKKMIFEFIHQDYESGSYFPFEGMEKSDSGFSEDERRALTFTNMNRILSKKEFNMDDPVLSKALEFYDSALQNDPWCQKQLQKFEQWQNSESGSVQSIYSKTLDSKFKDMREILVQEPELKKSKVYMIDYSMDR